MGKRRKPWSKAQIRRVVDSIWAGGYAAYRSREGWSIWLSGPGAGPSRRRFFIPGRVLADCHPGWLGNRLIAAMRQALDNLEGVRLISGSEALELVRWCTRWSRCPRHRLTAKQRARVKVLRRWYKKAHKVPFQGGGYTAERSRRGWVVRLSSDSAAFGGTTSCPSGRFAHTAGAGTACRSSPR